MKRYVADPTADPSGTSLQGYLNSATYAQLCKVFGPNTSDGDGYKVSTEWEIRDTQTNRVFTIYDYKMTRSYDSSGLTVGELRKYGYEWHVGGEHEGADEFIAWVNEEVKRA